MYEVDDLDAVVELHDVQQSDVGAPLPLVLSDEHNVLLAYLMSEPDPSWDGSSTAVVGPDSDARPVAIVRFRRPYAHMFGPPNDEAFWGHPLAGRGLRPYAAFEIEQSSWVRALERMNAVHPRHDRGRFLAGRRHFVFASHDTTFECVAEGFAVELTRGSLRSAPARMVQLLAEA